MNAILGFVFESCEKASVFTMIENILVNNDSRSCGWKFWIDTYVWMQFEQLSWLWNLSWLQYRLYQSPFPFLRRELRRLVDWNFCWGLGGAHGWSGDEWSTRVPVAYGHLRQFLLILISTYFLHAGFSSAVTSHCCKLARIRHTISFPKFQNTTAQPQCIKWFLLLLDILTYPVNFSHQAHFCFNETEFSFGIWVLDFIEVCLELWCGATYDVRFGKCMRESKCFECRKTDTRCRTYEHGCEWFGGVQKCSIWGSDGIEGDHCGRCGRGGVWEYQAS